MQRKFVQNLLLLLFLNLMVKPFWVFGIDRSVQNVVGTEAYGLYFVLFNFSFLLNVILDPGINSFNNRNIAQNNQLLSKHVSAIIPLKLCLSLLYFVFTLSVAMLLGYGNFSLKLLAFLAFNQVLASLVLYFRSNVAALHLFRHESILSVTDRLLMILFCGILLWGNLTSGVFKIEWFVYLQTLSYALTALLAFSIVYGRMKFLRFQFDYKFLLVILKKSYPFALLSILMVLYTRIDSVMLERLLPDGSYFAGIYAAAYRILDAMNMFAFLFASLLLPVFSRMLKERQQINEISGIATSLLIIPGYVLVFACFFYRNELMDLMYFEDSILKADVFGMLVFTFLATSLVYIYGTLLTANNSLRTLNMVSALGLCANVVLNLVLIPIYNVKGAVVATLLTQSLVAVIQSFIAVRKFKLKPTRKVIMKVILFLLICPLLYPLVSALSIVWYLQFAILIILCLTFAVLLKLIDFKNLIKLVGPAGKNE